MKKIERTTLILTTIACLLPILLGLYYYPQLPEQVAIHFNLHNQADGYAAKPLAVFGLPIFMAALQIFCCIITDLSRQNKTNQKIVHIFKWTIPLIGFATYALTIFHAIGYQLNIQLFVFLILGITSIVFGNYLPKLAPNASIGVRTTATRTNELVWYKTNRLFGYGMVLFGFLFLLGSCLPPILGIILIILYLLFSIFITIYSFVLAAKIKQTPDKNN